MPKSWVANAALAACLALGLSACGGGGGGSNVKPTPPPPPPVDTSPMVVSTDLAVASGQTVTRPIVLESGADLDNQGTLGGNVDIAVEAKAPSIVTNHGGGKIRSSKTAIRLDHGGELHNGAGSTIEATATGGTDCGAGVKCAIFAGSRESGNLALPPSPELVNEGSIIGNVKLWGDDVHWVQLYAGSSIQGDLDLGGQRSSILSLNGAAGTTQRYSQAVTGSTTLAGELQKGGDGAWIIDKDVPAFWAAIDGGTLKIGDGGTSGSLVGATTIYIFSGGTLVFDRSDDVASDLYLYGTSAPASMVKTGAGTLTLTSDHINVASVVIEDGTLRFNSVGAPSSGSSLRADAIINNGTLVFDGGRPLSAYAGISGSGSLIKDGSGKVQLGDANAYTGGTIVNQGLLWTYGTLPGNTQVNAGGVVHAREYAGDLSNAGTVDATGIEGYGHASIERIVVDGDYRQGADGTLMVSLGRRLDVAGTATLDGGTLEISSYAEDYVASAHTTVLTAAGGLAGTFDQVVQGSQAPVFTVTGIGYDANSVWLETQSRDVTVAAAGSGIGYTPASTNAAERVQGAFEQLNDRIATHTLAGVPDDFLHAAGQFQRAPSIKAAQASLRSLSGQLHAASAAMTFRSIDAGNEALGDHFDQLRDARAAAGMWTQQLGGNGSMARSGFDGVGYQFNGWLVGNDYRIGRNGVAGFAFGQGMGLQQLQHGIDRDDSRRTEGMVYAGLSGDRWYAQGRVGFGHVRQDIHRQLLLGSAADGVWTRYDSRYEAAYGESGLRFGVAGLRIAPFMSVEYARSDRDAFAEAGAGGFGLRSNAQALERWQASLGLRATRRWNFGHGRALDFGAHAQWRRELGADDDAIDASFVGLEQWSPLAGIGLSRRGSLVGVGLDAQLSPRAALKLSYQYERGQYDSAQGVSAGLSMAF